jgi:hypothetical protein
MKKERGRNKRKQTKQKRIHIVASLVHQSIKIFGASSSVTIVTTWEQRLDFR